MSIKYSQLLFCAFIAVGKALCLWAANIAARVTSYWQVLIFIVCQVRAIVALVLIDFDLEFIYLLNFINFRYFGPLACNDICF
uniref:Uncharacterized protein n=1 Tax=Nelumbo nucifera TaxID=4432 RepID=A0A822Y6K7_NELNU|nr:TPA_asm: hypothetical protein HUJ06_028133 [Nelumbo nucifera]